MLVSINASNYSQNEEVFFFSRESLLITHCKCMYTCVSHHYNGEKCIDSVTSVVFVQLNKDSCNYLNKAQTNKFMHKYYRIQKKSFKKLFLFEIQLITFFLKKRLFVKKKINLTHTIGGWTLMRHGRQHRQPRLQNTYGDDPHHNITWLQSTLPNWQTHCNRYI